MVLFNYSTKELTAKVVYYGPGLCGKTTNLQWIHEKLPIKNKGKMLSLATETDRTLFFDFLPIEIGTIRGMRTRIQLYTVPGQVFYNATRRMVLKGADCLVFVCDSQEPMLDANLESFENMRQNLEANEINADEIPVVFQYNKRDLPNALPLEIINERMNPQGQPFFEAVAVKGIGVEETLKGVTKRVFKSLSVKYGEGTGPYPAARPGRGRSPGRRRPAALKSPPPPRLRPCGPERPPSPFLPRPPVRPCRARRTFSTSSTSNPSGEAFEPSAEPRPNPRTTLVTGKREAEDLRRRIGMPAELEVDIEEAEVEEEADDLEEINLEDHPLAGLDGFDTPPPVPPARPAAARAPRRRCAASLVPPPPSLPPR